MQIISDFKIEIKNFMAFKEGAEDSFGLEIDLAKLCDNLKITSKLTADLRLIKVAAGILAFLNNAQVEIVMSCVRCLEEVLLELKFSEKAREYLSKDEPGINVGELDEENLFRVDLNNFTLDLSEFLREEIYLALPELVYCKKDCKGLCDQCGENLNIANCKCKRAPEEKSSPFQKLKDMIEE